MGSQFSRRGNWNLNSEVEVTPGAFLVLLVVLFSLGVALGRVAWVVWGG